MNWFATLKTFLVNDKYKMMEIQTKITKQNVKLMYFLNYYDNKTDNKIFSITIFDKRTVK